MVNTGGKNIEDDEAEEDVNDDKGIEGELNDDNAYEGEYCGMDET